MTQSETATVNRQYLLTLQNCRESQTWRRQEKKEKKQPNQPKPNTRVWASSLTLLTQHMELMLTHVNYYTLARSKQIPDKSDGFRAEGIQKGPWDSGELIA